MSLFKRPLVSFTVRVALPALLIIAAAIFAGLVILRDMVDQVDRAETNSAERSVRAALHSNLNRLGETLGDYAVWDDAVRKLYGEVDPVFVDSELRDSTRLGVLFNTVFVLDESDHTVLGFQDGASIPYGAEEEYGKALPIVVQQVRAGSRRYDTQTAILRARSGQIMMVAIGSILPFDDALAPPSRPRLMLIGRPIDEAAVARMNEEFVLDNLQLTSAAVIDRPGVQLLDPAGEVLGNLIWNPSTQGRQAFERIAPAAYLTTFLVCAAVLFLMTIGYSNFVALRRRERDAIKAAYHDALTGLPNRAALSRRLEEAVRQHDETGAPVALVYLDLDGFKEVNDANGHEAGDMLLKQVALGFASICAGTGYLARIGGDEFAVLLDRRETAEQAQALGERMVRFLDDPVSVDGRFVSVGTSIGVAILDDERIRPRELLRRADVAMYLAKEFGRNRVALYDPSIDAVRAERMRLAGALRDAIRNDDLAVLYQPILEASSMRPIGVEALIRWRHPVHGLVPPDAFIPIAEESGLIEDVGAWVLRRACRDALDWGDIHLSVNVSPVQLRNPTFDQRLSDLIAELGFPARRLEIEMTETHLVSYPERAQAIIARLRTMGVTVSLDDFGTGYSSIAYLRRFTFDKLKLDRSLVVGITSDSPARRLCEATIALGRSLDLKVTAEGVETEFEAAILRQAGCDFLQGYAFARPMSAEDVGRYLAEGRPIATIVSSTG